MDDQPESGLGNQIALFSGLVQMVRESMYGPPVAITRSVDNISASPVFPSQRPQSPSITSDKQACASLCKPASCRRRVRDIIPEPHVGACCSFIRINWVCIFVETYARLEGMIKLFFAFSVSCTIFENHSTCTCNLTLF